MKNKVAAFVFKSRKFFAIAAYTIPIIIKSILHSAASMQMLIAGLIVVAAGIALRIYSAGYLLGRHIVTKVEAEHLCTFGPFAHVRNPLYIGNILIGLGASIALNEWYGYAIILLNYIFMYLFIIPLEESFLQDKFGNDYIEYKNNIRRFVPRLKGYRSDTKVIFSFKKGFLSEKYYITILLINFVSVYFLFVR